MQQTQRQSGAPTPLAAASVSLGLYRHPAASARESIEQVVSQAALAEECGFDGLTLSEHHLGHPEYFPNPLLVSAIILGRTTRVWAAPLPMLLTLRPAATVVEDVAWIAATYPRRVALGVAAGNTPAEHALGESDDPAVDRFVRRLRTLSDSLVRPNPEQPVTRDPAVAEAAGRVPVVSAARSRGAVRRAAQLGLGILHSPVSSAARLASFTEEYLAAGGQGRRVLIAGAWLDDAGTEGASDESTVTWSVRGTAERVVEALCEQVAACRADAVNVRLRASGAGLSETNAQIEAFGAEVLPAVRAALHAHSA